MKKKDINILKANLPKIPGINGKNEYFNSVVLLLLILIENEYHIVFQKRCANIIQGGEICLPGGKCEENETLEMTAIRETEEELGIPKEKIQIIGRLDTVIAPMGATVDVFIGLADIEINNIQANPDEVEKVFTIPVSYFEKIEPETYSAMIKVHPTYIDKKSSQEVVLLPSEELGLPEKYRKAWGGFKHKILVYKAEEGIIWGITSRIIYDFVKKLATE